MRCSAVTSWQDGSHLFGADFLVDFRLEFGLPVWQYEIDGVTIEKQILLPHGQNTVFVIYRLVAGNGPVRLKLLPAFISARTTRR